MIPKLTSSLFFEMAAPQYDPSMQPPPQPYYNQTSQPQYTPQPQLQQQTSNNNIVVVQQAAPVKLL